MNFRIFAAAPRCRWIPLVILLTAAAFAQDAQLTFYSTGHLAADFAPKANISFRGLLYDGDRQLGYLDRDRFLTMAFPPGVHQFSASYSGHPAKNSVLTLDLQPGKQYFVRATARSINAVVLSFDKGILEEVACSQARREAIHTQPIKLKHVSRKARSSLAPITQLPACP